MSDSQRDREAKAYGLTAFVLLAIYMAVAWAVKLCGGAQ